MGVFGSAARSETDAGGHYATLLLKGPMTQGMYDRTLNQQHDKGYRLSHIYEIGNTTVMIFERRA